MKYLLALGIALFSISSVASEIVIQPVTLRRGMEGDTKQSGALDKPENYIKNKVYAEQKEMSSKAGIDIDKFLDKIYANAFMKKPPPDRSVHYQLFYNSISAPNCKKEYLIQRVKQTKIYYKKNGKIAEKSEKYLVEVFKLNSYRQTKRADAHHQFHFLGKATSRKTVVDIEVGCGEIGGVAAGFAWPFDRKILYKLAQDYSDKIGLYEKVDFEFSRSYSFTSEFDRSRNKIIWPDFLEGNL